MSATMTVGPAKLDWLSASSASSEDVSAAWRFISFIVFFLTSLAPVDDSWPAVGVDVAATGTCRGGLTIKQNRHVLKASRVGDTTDIHIGIPHIM